MNLLDMGLALQRKSVSRKQKDYVSLDMGIAGEMEAEVVYELVPAFKGKPDEAGYDAHIEIHSCYLLYTITAGNERIQKRVDLTGLVDHDEKLFREIQRQILG